MPLPRLSSEPITPSYQADLNIVHLTECIYRHRQNARAVFRLR